MIKRINNVVPNLLERMNIPGVAIGFISDYEISEIKTYGYANKEKGIPITEKTIFQIASISKSMTAWGTMKLVEKGLIEIDAPAENYLTRWHFPPSEFNHDDITIRRLLSHTAGFPVDGFSGLPPDFILPPLGVLLSRNAEYSLDDKQKKYCEKWNVNPEKVPVKVIEQPGNKFVYSNGGYTVLELIIEEVTKQSFSEYLAEEIFNPLGMTSSTFEWPTDFSGHATPYDEEENPYLRYKITSKASGGCFSTIRDLTTFALAEMKGSKGELPGRGILKPESINLMHSKVIYAEREFDIDWDYGLGHYIANMQGRKIIQHSGGIVGWRSMMVIVPEIGAGITILINSDAGNPLWANLLMRWQRVALKK